MRLDREVELFEDRPDDELREAFVPADVPDLDLDRLPPDELFAADLPALFDPEDESELALPLFALFAPPVFLEDELEELRLDEEPDEPALVEVLRDDLLLVERDEPPLDEAELRFAFDPDEALLPAERDLPLPLDLPEEGDDERFEDELPDFALEPAIEERSLPLMFAARAVCTTLAAPSTAPIAALVKSVPAASAALDNKPFDFRLLFLDFRLLLLDDF